MRCRVFTATTSPTCRCLRKAGRGAKSPPKYDVLLSNKSAFCIGARPLNPNAKHICYCLTPTRFTYDFEGYVGRGEKMPPGAAAILRALNAYLRKWETQAAQRVHTFIAISREVQQRIKTLYGRESVIIYPPVEMPEERGARSEERGAFYLIVSRLLPYKRVDLAIEAFANLGCRWSLPGMGATARVWSGWRPNPKKSTPTPT